MKKFLLIYGANSEAMQHWGNTTDEQKEQDMQNWFTWMQKHADTFADEGNPVGKNTRVFYGNKQEEVSNEIAGYSILLAEEKEQALEILKENPHTTVKGTYIELMEIVDMEM